MRHTGASAAVQESANKGAALAEVKRRGRWLSDKSVRRYTKTHLLVAARAGTPADVLDFGEKFWAEPLASFVVDQVPKPHA